MAVDLFPPEASAELDGPAWLRSHRAAAVSALASTDLPSTDLEEWRYSRIRDLRPERFSPLPAAAAAETAAQGHVPVAAAALIAELGELAGVVVLHNGVGVDGVGVLGGVVRKT